MRLGLWSFQHTPSLCTRKNGILLSPSPFTTKRGRGEISHEEVKLQAGSKDEAILEATKIKEDYVAKAEAEKKGHGQHPAHGLKRYIDMQPLHPKVICKISLR